MANFNIDNFGVVSNYLARMLYCYGSSMTDLTWKPHSELQLDIKAALSAIFIEDNIEMLIAHESIENHKIDWTLGSHIIDELEPLVSDADKLVDKIYKEQGYNIVERAKKVPYVMALLFLIRNIESLIDFCFENFVEEGYIETRNSDVLTDAQDIMMCIKDILDGRMGYINNTAKRSA